MKKLFFLACLLATSCKQEEAKKADLSAFPAVKLGVSVSSDLAHVFFDRITNGTFKKIAEANPQIEMKFANGEDNYEKQLGQINEMLDAGVQAMVLHIGNVNDEQARHIVQLLCTKKIPAVYFNVFPGEKNLANCPNAYFVGADNIQIGVAQGLAVLKHWKEHPEWDKNKDGVLQFAQVQAMPNWDITIKRSDWPVQTIMNYPNISVQAEAVLRDYGLFDSNVAKEVGLKWLQSPDFEKVEVILSNDDDMASGIIEALKTAGKQLPIFGADGSDWALTAVKSGDLVHSVNAGLDVEAATAVRLATNLAAGYPESNQIPLMFNKRVVLIPPKEL